MKYDLYKLPQRLDIDFEAKVKVMGELPCNGSDIYHAQHHSSEIETNIIDPVIVGIKREKPHYVHTCYTIISQNDLHLFA